MLPGVRDMYDREQPLHVSFLEGEILSVSPGDVFARQLLTQRLDGFLKQVEETGDGNVGRGRFGRARAGCSLDIGDFAVDDRRRLLRNAIAVSTGLAVLRGGRIGKIIVVFARLARIRVRLLS